VSDFLPTLVGIALVACAAGFALLPLARGSRAAPVRAAAPASDRSLIYQQVLEVEFDYQVGKLSTEDFSLLSAQLLGQAGELMRAERGDIGELDDEIEREIAAARAAFAAVRRTAGSKRAAGTPR
jgi:hypothetical protein